MNIIKAYGTFEQKVFNLLPQKEQESWVATPKLARLGIKAIVATGGFMTFVAAPIVAVSPQAPAPTVAQAPAPIEQVVEAPTPVEQPETVTNGALPTEAIDLFGETEVAETSLPAPTAPSPAATPNYEYPTRQGALDEMCAAARQYGNDIYEGWMNTRQAKHELNEYARYLSRKSPVSRSELLTTGKACARSWYF